MTNEVNATRQERPLERAVVPADSEQAAYDNLRLTCTTHHEMCRMDTLICPFGTSQSQVKCWTCSRGWPFGHNSEFSRGASATSAATPGYARHDQQEK